MTTKPPPGPDIPAASSPFAPIDPLTGLPVVVAKQSSATRIPYKLPGAKNRTHTVKLGLPADAPWIPPSTQGLAGLTLGSAWLRINIVDRILAAGVESTITGASVVTLRVHDPNLVLLNSGLLQQRCRIRLGGFVFELVRVKKTGYVLQLEFEDAVVAELRTRRDYKTWKAGTISAVGVIRWLISEKTKKGKALPGVRLYAPLDPGGGAGSTIAQHGQTAAPVSPGQARDPGLAHKAIHVKGVPASTQQTDNLNVVLKTIMRYHPRPTTAELVIAVMTVITESSAINNPGGSGSSVGLFQQTPEGGYKFDRTDRVLATQAFYERLHKLTTNPAYDGTPLYGYAQAVQRSGAGAASGGASNYGPQEGDAKQIVAAFLGTGGVDGAAFGLGPNVPDLGTTVSGKPKTFHRGQPHTPEDSWSCMQRMAREVNYRCFVVGDILYFLGDARLLASESRLSLNNGTPGVAQLDFDIDVGKRVSEVTLQVAVEAWSVPPGSVVTLSDVGPAVGDWIVDTVSADLVKPSHLTIKLTRPRVPLKESADPVSRTAPAGAVLPPSGVFTPGSSPDPVTGIASAPNTGGGSYAALTTAHYIGPDQGIDFTGAGPIFALADGVVTRVVASGTGWSGDGAILVYQMLTGPRRGQYVYVAEDFVPAPGLSVGQRFAKGATIGQATGSGHAPGIEVGFAQDAHGTAYGTIRDGKPGGPAPTYGYAMQAFVQQLSAGR